MRIINILAASLLLQSLTLPVALASDFAPVTEEQRSLSSVPGEPDAPAVYLFSKAEFWMMDPLQRARNSWFKVQQRLKILNQEGQQKFAEVKVRHSRYLRFSNLKGRTIMPDGEVVPLTDAVFTQVESERKGWLITSFPFPAVEAGAILDYRYELRFDSPYLLWPWLFQSEIPTLYSEIVYYVPDNVSVRVWGRGQIKQEELRSAKGHVVKYWAENLPSLPKEPYSYSAESLSSKVVLIPTEFLLGHRYPLFRDWPALCSLIEEAIYEPARSKSGTSRKQAKQIAAELEYRREKALALFRFVRDEILTDGLSGVLYRESLDRLLSEGRGEADAKALLLHKMLETVGIDSQIVWVPNRSDGKIDPDLPNTDWFNNIILRVELDGSVIFLDPSDRRLGFGQLAPENEGVQALLFHPKAPRFITIPKTHFQESRKKALINLRLDPEGALSGNGKLSLKGHYAWSEMTGLSADEAARRWKDWLAEKLEGYEVAEVEVKESVADREVEVVWKMSQPEEEVLGDEASLNTSLPLGLRQIFAPKRRSGVLLPFCGRQEVEVHLGWPEGWQLMAQPQAVNFEDDVGEIAVSIVLDEEARTLAYKRRFDLMQDEISSSRDYRALRSLYSLAEKNDAQSLVLVRR